jgi:hypothetical protein
MTVEQFGAPECAARARLHHFTAASLTAGDVIPAAAKRKIGSTAAELTCHCISQICEIID